MERLKVRLASEELLNEALVVVGGGVDEKGGVIASDAARLWFWPFFPS